VRARGEQAEEINWLFNGRHFDLEGIVLRASTWATR
jgi:hypothetical protein